MISHTVHVSDAWRRREDVQLSTISDGEFKIANPLEYLLAYWSNGTVIGGYGYLSAHHVVDSFTELFGGMSE